MKRILMYTLMLLLSLFFIQFKDIEKREFKSIAKNRIYVNKLKRLAFSLDDYNYLGFDMQEVNSKTGEWIKELSYFSVANDCSKEIISKVDMSDGLYSDTLLFFEDIRSDKQVILWKLEGEYWSYINIYLFHDNIIKLLGDISLGIVCEDCDSFNFPEKNILVKGNKEKIEVGFQGNTIYRGSESQNVPYHSVDIKTEKLVFSYSKNKSNISY